MKLKNSRRTNVVADRGSVETKYIYFLFIIFVITFIYPVNFLIKSRIVNKEKKELYKLNT